MRRTACFLAFLFVTAAHGFTSPPRAHSAARSPLKNRARIAARGGATATPVMAVSAPAQAFAAWYMRCLSTAPVPTKSVTFFFISALGDLLSQAIQVCAHLFV